MLTDEQKRDLETRNVEGVTARRRADIVHRFTGKLNDRLDGLNDINYLINELPDSSIKNTVSKEHLFSAFKLVENLLEILYPIYLRGIGNEDLKYVKTYSIKDIKGLRGMMYYSKEMNKNDSNNIERVRITFPATEYEIEIHNEMEKHKNIVNNIIYGLRKEKKEVYSLPEFSKIINEIAARRGQIYEIETIYSSAEVVKDDPQPGDYATLPEINDAIVNFVKKENQETRS
jgi:hypothetical protein